MASGENEGDPKQPRTERYRTPFIQSPLYGLFHKEAAGPRQEPGIKTKMRVKLAAKLLIIAWTLMKKKELSPDHLVLE